MPSNKSSLYDGQVHILHSSLDLTGKIGLADGAYTAGSTTLTYDGGTADFVAGDEVYGCEATGSGKIKHIGTVSSVSVNSGTSGGGNLDATITLTAAAKISGADNSHIIKDLPKFEIAAIQIIKAGTLTNLIPAENRFPRTIQADGATSFDDGYEVSYYGATDSSAGVAISGDIDPGITIEGRWKHATISSTDVAICHLKAVAYRGLKDMQ